MTTTVGMEVFLPMQGLEPAAGAEALGLRGLGHPQASQAVHGARLPLLGRRGGDRVAESGQKSDGGLIEQKPRQQPAAEDNRPADGPLCLQKGADRGQHPSPARLRGL